MSRIHINAPSPRRTYASMSPEERRRFCAGLPVMDDAECAALRAHLIAEGIITPATPAKD